MKDETIEVLRSDIQELALSIEFEEDVEDEDSAWIEVLKRAKIRAEIALERMEREIKSDE